MAPGTTEHLRPAVAVPPRPASAPLNPMRGFSPANRNALRIEATMPAPDVVVLPFWPVDSSQFRPYVGLKADTLTLADLQQLAGLLQRVQQENQLDCTPRYYHQYISATDARGRRLVWVNGFYRTNGDYWKQQIYEVKGGGECFYNVLINLSDSQYSNFSINAPK